MIELKNAIAITGGIATGKSSVCNLLKLYGYSIIDADTIAHNTLYCLHDKVVLAFGDGILDSNGNIDRKKLGEIVFSNPQKKEILQSILHPMIRNEILSRAEQLERYSKVYFIDIPLFFEVKERYSIHKVLLVYTPKEIQLNRLIKRDGIDVDLALKKIQSQMDIEAKKLLSTYIVDNSKDLSYLQLQIEAFLKTI